MMCDRICHSPNGWTDVELGMMWIQDFDNQTEEKAAGQTRAVFLDGHSSHNSPELLRFAQSHGIEILSYPPHCTHALQGLDVICFARMKDLWKQKVTEFEEENKCNVTKGTFTGVFGKAFSLAFTPETIKAAFRVTGIHPYDPSVITPQQMKPSEPTSTKCGFPLPQPSPVQAIMSAYRCHPPTSFDIDPDTHCGPGASSSNLQHEGLQRHLTDSDINPFLDDSPSNYVRLMTAGLASTASGSFLVSRDPVTSQSAIPAPVYEMPPPIEPIDQSALLDHHDEPTKAELKMQIDDLTEQLRHAKEHIQTRNSIIEGAHAQMVLQNLFVEKQSQVLGAKEKKKVDKRTKLFPEGKGRWLTDTELIEELDKDTERRDQKEVEKEERAVERERKKKERDEIEIEWKAAQAAHDQAVQGWKAECEALTAQKVAKKSHPKRPFRPKKRKATKSIVVPDADSSNSSEGESD